MSNYHYSDQRRTNDCLQNNYVELKDTTNYNCDLKCLCRFGVDERSDKDKMYYSWFVLDQPMKLPASGDLQQPKTNCK